MEKHVKDLREENRGPDLNGEFDIATIIRHVVERLLHVCPEEGSVFQYDSVFQHEQFV
jgi:hypothetical protein